MDMFLSHISAAEFWQVPCLEIFAKELIELTGDSRHFTFTKPSNIRRKKGVIPHLCQSDLPPNALISHDGFFISSPELVYLQLANHLEFEKVILLGLQLCSHPPGKPAQALTNKKKLGKFLDEIPKHRGKEIAVKSLKYIENGSASIMESLTFMILTLPNFMGGYGLKGPVFNYEIKIKDNLAKRIEQNSCFVDLYFKDKRVAVEYDSFAWHNSPANQGRDALRAGVLKRQGIEVFSLSTIQLYDKDACRDFACNLAKSMDRRVQIRTYKFYKKHLELRKLLPQREDD